MKSHGKSKAVIAAVIFEVNSLQSSRFGDSRQLPDYGFDQIQKRDASRAATSVSMKAQPDSVRPYQPVSFTIQLNDVSAAYTAKAQWYVNGEPVSNYGNNNFQVTANKTSTLNYTLRELNGGTLDVSFVLTMPDGTEKRADTSVPIEQRPLSYTGSFNIHSAEVYPGKTLTVTADVLGENGIYRVQLPAGWQWDGQPIAGYSNDAFTIFNDHASSQYTIKVPIDAQPGSHTLSFVVGPADSTGVQQLILSADIVIVPQNDMDEGTADSTEEIIDISDNSEAA